MMRFQREQDAFADLNGICQGGGAVIFGATFASKLHVSELAQDYNMNVPMYNRSVVGLSIFDAKAVLDVCVEQLKPDQVFMNLGEMDLDFQGHSLEETIMQYEWLLYEIHNRVPGCRINIMSVCVNHPNVAKFNKALKVMAKQGGCDFVDMLPVADNAHPEVRAFGILRAFLSRGHICFGDAMTLAGDYL